jgi:hypothetical protein
VAGIIRDFVMPQKLLIIFFFESAKFIRQPTAQEVLEGAEKEPYSRGYKGQKRQNSQKQIKHPYSCSNTRNRAVERTKKQQNSTKTKCSIQNYKHP